MYTHDDEANVDIYAHRLLSTNIVMTIDVYRCISWRVEGTNADIYVRDHRCIGLVLTINIYTHAKVEDNADMYVH